MFLATVRFRGFGHDGSGGVAVLDVRRGRAHYPRRGAGGQTQSCCQRCQSGYQHADNDLDNFLFSHNSLIKTRFDILLRYRIGEQTRVLALGFESRFQRCALCRIS